VRNFRGFPAGGRTILRRIARSRKRRRILSKRTYGYSLYGLGHLFQPIPEEISLSYYLLELGTSLQEEGAW
jgi:hypothetical protein